MPDSLAIVVPCYNEEAVLPETARRLAGLLCELIGRGLISTGSRVYFVDDGSRDGTWKLIASLAREVPFMGIKLSRNRGHQNALLAGLLQASGDIVVTVDADLQQDLGAIAVMLGKFAEGHEIVLGIRDSRESETRFKRWSGELYYRLLQLIGVEVAFNHADYRLLSRRAIEFLRQYTEVNLFLRGVVPTLGLKTATVPYRQSERFAGEPKYGLIKMLGLAWDGITSFSAVPLRAVSALGAAVFLFSIAMSLWVLYVRGFTTRAVPGWASTLVPMYFLGGVQLFSIGIVGEYLSKIYLETKRRPRYLIEEIVGLEAQTPVATRAAPSAVALS